jgi:hypothetical protein
MSSAFLFLSQRAGGMKFVVASVSMRSLPHESWNSNPSRLFANWTSVEYTDLAPP